MMSARYVFVALTAMVLTAGCSAERTSGPSAPTAPVATVDATRIWGQFVACARANGYPSWPDAIVDPNTGAASFPPVAGFEPKSAFEALRQPCGDRLSRLPAQANPLDRPVVSPSEIGAKLAYSRCMRENGVPEWQDPGADGYYTDGGIPGYNSDPAVTARVNAARDKCDPILGR